MYPKSGYKIVTAIQLVNVLALLHEQSITTRTLRVYFAALAALAAREAAERVRRAQFERGDLKQVHYEPRELATLCGLTEAQTKSELRRLTKNCLLQFSNKNIHLSLDALPQADSRLALVRAPTRPVPVPRAVLRSLAKEERKSVSQAMIAYMIRGLTISRTGQEISGKGTAKLSWICNLTGLSERGARYARGELIRLGWIARDTNSFQRKLNRDGAYFSVNLDWSAQPPGDSAPPRAKKCGPIAPLSKYKKSPYGSKNQKTNPPGVFPNNPSLGNEPQVTLRNVRKENLSRISHCEALYWQAVGEGLLSHCENSALNFLAAAVRARSIPTGDPARVFVAIIRKRLWKNITCEQEEVARKTLQRIRHDRPNAFFATAAA